jgi:hypothetical protein
VHVRPTLRLGLLTLSTRHAAYEAAAARFEAPRVDQADDKGLVNVAFLIPPRHTDHSGAPHEVLPSQREGRNRADTPC